MLQQAGLNAFTRFSATSPNIGGHKLEIRLHAERNAAVKAALPCETWKLLYYEVVGRRPIRVQAINENATRMEDMQIHGTYLTRAAADAEGMAVAREILDGSDIQEIDIPDLASKVWVRGGNPSQFVQVSYDTGAAPEL